MKKKALFVDRDGTLILEPPVTYQVDTLEKLEFLPGVIRVLYNISQKLDFELVMVSNQDGLGTSSYPMEQFELVQNKMLQVLKNEGIHFKDILIDKSFPHENLPTRKPGIGMLTKYLDGSYDLDNSFVIGDRITDIMLAKNLGSKGILIGNYDRRQEIIEKKLERYCTHIANNWDEIYSHISLAQRTIHVRRKTRETDINILINLDGQGECFINTGLGFFDHMLEQIGRHGGFDLNIEVQGDLHVDEHHTIEDTALALGDAINQAIGSKIGMHRYGFCLPMDDSLAQVAIDFGGRNWLVWDVEFKRDKVGEVPTEMFFHFFKSFTDTAKCNLNVKATGDNDHHKIESIFKAFARSMKMALKRDPFSSQLPSTKGVL